MEVVSKILNFDHASNILRPKLGHNKAINIKHIIKTL
jgi:hypothetical protein